MRRMLTTTACATALLSASCTAIPAALYEFIDPAFLNSLGIGTQPVTTPGEAPAVILEIENKTSFVIEANLAWRTTDSGTVEQRPVSIGSSEKYSELVFCPLTRVTLGELGDSEAIGAIVRYGAGTAADPFVEVEPFGRDLVVNVNYDCGDVVTFTVLPSSQTLSGYQIFAFIRRSGAQ